MIVPDAADGWLPAVYDRGTVVQVPGGSSLGSCPMLSDDPFANETSAADGAD